PHTWYPNARRKKRNVFLHVGPTNSGKTYNALKRLESSSSGVYCGPLRLLAWEVAQRLNKAKVPCNLITGQEREEIDDAKHSSVTVEMADVTSEYQCAVIDEIQMVGCRTRGFSFTRALLGISSDELHLCGDPAAVPLIQRILAVTGDVIKVQYYDRLLPLIPLKYPLGSFSNIKTGDCIVTFSRCEIYKLKKKIENGRKHLCSVVYGSLPPETRTKQATMFNDESSEFGVLVASDAIGMGLNLNISRIIFSTLKKFDGVYNRELTVAEIKQIAVASSTFELESSNIGTILWKGFQVIDMNAAACFSCLNAHFLVQEQFLEKAKLSPDYFIADCEHMLKVALVVDTFPLGLYDKYLFCLSPVDMNDDIAAQGLTQFAENYAKKGLVRLREIFTPGTLQVPKSHNALKELESIHKVLDLYVWLSFRMEDSFPDRELASSQKAICSLLIEEFLERLGWQRQGKGSYRHSPLCLQQKISMHSIVQPLP
ncbi:ATP-dependent RNA helicase SUV3, mitochondrial, partial [Cocos nucifera]